jgi:hypothetical protein
MHKVRHRYDHPERWRRQIITITAERAEVAEKITTKILCRFCGLCGARRVVSTDSARTRTNRGPAKIRHDVAQAALRRRRAAAERACFDSALREAARFGSRFSVRSVARDRFADGFVRFRVWPAR